MTTLGKPSIKKNGIFHDIWQKGGWVADSNQISLVNEIMTFGWEPISEIITCIYVFSTKYIEKKTLTM